MNIRRSIATVGAAGALTAGSLFLASPAQAAPVAIIPGGLVTVTLVDLVDIDDVTIQVPLAIAANVCDIDINVLAAQVAAGDTTCDAAAVSSARN